MMKIFEIEKLIADFYEGKHRLTRKRNYFTSLRLRKCPLIYWQKKTVSEDVQQLQ